MYTGSKLSALAVTALLLGAVVVLNAEVEGLGVGPDLDLSDAHASFIGEDANDFAGFSVADAGDVNGDGYDDILIGAYQDDDGGSNAGQTYLIMGKASGWSMDTDLSAADASFWGEDSYDYAGRSVAGAGDVNGDGYDDILIGAYYDEDGGSGAGQTYLVLGKASGWSMDTDLSDADASFIGEDDYDYAGGCVAGAGDVNGDGYDDILIGAYYDEDGGSGAGQTYLVLGKASGWSMDTDLSDADASFIGEDDFDYAGWCVAGAGDVSGDGYDDILIGAYGDDDGGSYAGQTYLVLGKPTGWSMDTDLSAADASFWGEDSSDYAGYSVAGAGDVNGDGYDDILIAADRDEDGGAAAGQTYLVLGKPTGWSMDTDLSAADASFWGEDFNDLSGRSVASAGDVNGDGYDEILIGAYGDDDGGSAAGQTYLVLGKASGWSMDTDLSTADASFWGEEAGDDSGYSVSSAGDVNGDGYDEILVGAYGNDHGGTSAGQTYLVFYECRPNAPRRPEAVLSEDGSHVTVSWDPLAYQFLVTGYDLMRSVDGTNYHPVASLTPNTMYHVDRDVSIGVTYYYAVSAMAKVGGASPLSEPVVVMNEPDTDGDGMGDSMDTDDDGDGVPDELDPHRLVQDTMRWARQDVSLGSFGVGLLGEAGSDFAGRGSVMVGDVNGDGFDDLLVAAAANDEGGTNVGQTYLFLGSAEGWSSDLSLGSADASFFGESVGDNTGYSLAGAGDVNGDGFDDIMIGAPYWDYGGSNTGKVYLVLGRAGGWSMHTSLSTADASFWGEDAGDYAGISIAGAGDVNGDGFDDMLVGAHGDEEGGLDAGQTYLVLGRASGWTMDTSLSTADASFLGEAAGASSGRSVAGAGDVNGDGYDDILVGAYLDDDAGVDAGQTYLVLGKASGWAMDVSLSNADASFRGEAAGEYAGFSVQGAGDVNGDGLDDILIGAPYSSANGPSSGQAYLVLGKASGWAMDTSLSASDSSFVGETGYDVLGIAVAGGGDLNGDGYDDIVLGATGDDDAGISAGQAYVLFGNSSVWSMDTSLSEADATFWGERANDNLGGYISCDGDVNGDGCDDLLLGAPYNDETASNAGKAYLLNRTALEPTRGLVLGLPTTTVGASLNWIDSCSAPYRYGIYRGCDAASLERIALTDDPDYLDTNVSAGVEYAYAVVCVCPLGGESPVTAVERIVADRDTDGDGEGDLADWDDDGDGVADHSDAFPRDPTETLDTDGDGVGNNADPDDDNDGVADGADAWPLSPMNDVEATIDDIKTTVDALDISTLTSTLASIQSDLGALRTDVSGLASAVWMMEGNLTAAMAGMNASLQARIGSEVATVLSRLGTVQSNVRGLVEGMWADYNATAASDRGAVISSVTSMGSSVLASLSGVRSDLLTSIGDAESNMLDALDQLEAYLAGEMDMDQQETAAAMAAVWAGLNATLDGMEAAMGGRLGEVEANLTGDIDGLGTDLSDLEDYLSVRLAELELYMELANASLHLHLDAIEASLEGLGAEVMAELSNVSAFLEGMAENDTTDRQQLMDAIQATSDLLESMEETTLAELRTGIEGIHDYLEGMNSSEAEDRAGMLEDLLAGMDALGEGLSSDIEGVNSSLVALEKLDTIMTELEGVDASVSETHTTVEDGNSADTTMGVVLLVLLVVVILLLVLLMLRGRGPGGPDLEEPVRAAPALEELEYEEVE